MKIIYHHRTASSDGQAVHIEEMVAALRSLGHQVLVVGPGGGRRAMGSKVGWVHWLKSVLPKSSYELLELGYSLVAFVRLAAAVRQFRPDIIYERYNLFLMSGLMAGRWYRLPLVLEINGPAVLERSNFGGIALTQLARWSEATIWRGADHLLPVTRVLAGHVFAVGVPEARVTVIANGINLAHFANAPDHEQAKARLGLAGRQVLGFIGFVREWHGVDRVIRWIASSPAAATAHLIVVGEGPARASLERLAEEQGVAGRVTFTGVVARERIPEHVAAFDVALQPAVVPYASPLKVFEYLAMGKPIVAPRQPNMEEILVDGRNAILFDPRDEQGLASALDMLVSDPAMRARLAASAERTVHERGFTWLENAKRVSWLCERLLAPGAPVESDERSIASAKAGDRPTASPISAAGTSTERPIAGATSDRSRIA